MVLKDWPYWLKGGILAVILVILYLIIIPFFTGSSHGGGIMGGYILIPLFGIPIFLIGAFVGWIYSKIKKK